MSHSNARIRVLRILVIGAVTFGCGGGSDAGPTGPGTPDVRTPSSLVVASGSGQNGAVGEVLSAPISVKVLDAQGRPVSAATVSWSAAAGNGSAVEATSTTGTDGVATTHWRIGTTPGAQSLTATVGSVTPFTITATAAAGPASRVVIVQDSVRFAALLDTASFSAQVTDAFNNPVTAVPVVWSSSSAAIASVDASGKVTAAGNGTAIIAATSGAVRDTIIVRIKQVATTIALSTHALSIGALTHQVAIVAAVRDRNSQAITQAHPVWGSSAPAVATVDSAGTVTAIANGTARIVATSESVSDTATVTVRQVAASVTIAPSVVTIATGGIGTIGTAIADSASIPVEQALQSPLTFTTSQPSIATANATTGTVTAGAPGITVLRAEDPTNASLRDSAYVVVAGPTSVLTTLMPTGGDGRIRAVAGTTVRVPLVLDISRDAATGDVGALDITLTYDNSLLQLDSARVISGGVDNPTTPGTYRLAYAAANPAAGGNLVQLSVLYFKVKANTAVQRDARIDLTYAYAPATTSFTLYPAPIVVPGRITVPVVASLRAR